MKRLLFRFSILFTNKNHVRTGLVVIFTLIVFSSFNSYSNKVPTNDYVFCELKASYTVSLDSNNQNVITISVPDGKDPVKYLFFRKSGELLTEDPVNAYTNSMVINQKGNYFCVIIDTKGCSTKIYFEIK